MAKLPVKERVEPRISVNDLALYMVSSQTGQIGILRRAKSPQAPLVARYKDARSAICTYLSDQNRSVNPLLSAEEMLQQRRQDLAVKPLMREDAANSIEVLHAIQRMKNKLGIYDFYPAPRDQEKLVINGVTVSVRADLLVHGNAKGIDQIGAAVLRMTMDDAENEAAREKRKNVGLYVATLARIHAERNLAGGRAPANRLCLSIDVQHGEVFVAPNANTRRVNDVENACLMIAAVWPAI